MGSKRHYSTVVQFIKAECPQMSYILNNVGLGRMLRQGTYTYQSLKACERASGGYTTKMVAKAIRLAIQEGVLDPPEGYYGLSDE